MRRKRLILAAALMFLMAVAAVAAEPGKGEAKETGRAATGAVLAVTPASRTLVVESRLGGEPWILGVVVPANLAIKDDGKTKTLEELKAGDRVRIRWARTENELVAESIAVVERKSP